MAKKIVVELPDNLYQRAQQFARRHQQDVETIVSDLFEDALAAREAEDEVVKRSALDLRVARERAAYVAMHATLKEQLLGKYVAIYDGALVDQDDDSATLASRIKARYPAEFVLITQVRKEPIRTITVRSPRLVRDAVS